MSLTSHLKDEDSPVRQFLVEALLTETARKVIDSHCNALQSVVPLVVPGSDRMAVGGAFTYMYSWMFSPRCWHWHTVAYYAREFQSFIDQCIAFGTERPQSRAAMSYALYQVEQFVRTKEMPPFLDMLLKRNSIALLPECIGKDDQIRRTIWDIHLLSEQMETFRDVLASDDLAHPPRQNVRFTGSRFIGGADAQMIRGSDLIDIRCTAARQPFGEFNYLQQLGYAVLDIFNKWKIERLIWVYPRQKHLIAYKLIDLCPNIEAIRAEFARRFVFNRLGAGWDKLPAPVADSDEYVFPMSPP